jgi:hypothetical protein
MTSTQVFVGIDISKAQLDLALRPEGQFSAPNNEAGFAQVLERLNAVHPTLYLSETPRRGMASYVAQHETRCRAPGG